MVDGLVRGVGFGFAWTRDGSFEDFVTKGWVEIVGVVVGCAPGAEIFEHVCNKRMEYF